MSHLSRSILTVLFASALLAALPSRALATNAWENYIPPEIAYAEDLRHKVSLPGRIDVNHAGIAQLETLPGFDENLALKVIRLRPMASVQEFYAMPGVTKKDVDRFIRQITPRVEFR